MKLWPFHYTVMVTKLSETEIKEIISKTSIAPSWNFSIEKMWIQQVLEFKISKDRILLGQGKYSLTFGKVGLVPIARIKIIELKEEVGEENSHSRLNIFIRPRMINLLIMLIFYLIGFFGIYLGIKKGMSETVIICSLVILVTYIAIITRYNQATAGFLLYIKDKLKANLVSVNLNK